MKKVISLIAIRALVSFATMAFAADAAKPADADKPAEQLYLQHLQHSQKLRQ